MLVLRLDRRAAPGSLLHSFERHLRAQNRSERTVGNYLESARLAEAFLEGRGPLLEEATQADLEDFLADILRRRRGGQLIRVVELTVVVRWIPGLPVQCGTRVARHAPSGNVGPPPNVPPGCTPCRGARRLAQIPK